MPMYRFAVMELAEAGFGSPEVLMRERVDLVIDAHDYLRYRARYDHEAYLLSREE
jgi:hypothetical protein